MRCVGRESSKKSKSHFRYRVGAFLFSSSKSIENRESSLTDSTQNDVDVVLAVGVGDRAVVAAEVLALAVADDQRRLHAERGRLLEHRVISILTAIDFPTVVRPNDVSRLGNRKGNAFNLYRLTGNTKLLFRGGD